MEAIRLTFTQCSMAVPLVIVMIPPFSDPCSDCGERRTNPGREKNARRQYVHAVPLVNFIH